MTLFDVVVGDADTQTSAAMPNLAVFYWRPMAVVPFKRVLLPAVQWEQCGCLVGTLYVRCVDPFDEKLDIKHHFMCSELLRCFETCAEVIFGLF